jgi:NAD(P)-dependent dehydrogenase (short-subunit alcohol dehydrogenase family)
VTDCTERHPAAPPNGIAGEGQKGTLMDPDGPADAIGNAVPRRKWGQPEDVANAIRFLAGPEASHVTGANIPVGGAAAVG